MNGACSIETLDVETTAFIGYDSFLCIDLNSHHQGVLTMIHFYRHAMNLLVLSSMILFFANPALAQTDVDCDTPKRIKWEGEAAVTIEAGKQECEEAKRLAGMANDMFDRANKHKEIAERQRKRAEELRKDAKGKRDTSKDRDKDFKKLPKDHEDLTKRNNEVLDMFTGGGDGLAQKASFTGAEGSVTEVPSFNGYTWADVKTTSKEAMDAYVESSTSLHQVELEAAESMVLYFEQQATMLEQDAELRDSRATQHTEVAAAAEQAAHQIVAAAHVREQASILHTVMGTMAFLNEGNARDKKEVERAIKYIESQLGKMPQSVAKEAQTVLTSSRESIQ